MANTSSSSSASAPLAVTIAAAESDKPLIDPSSLVNAAQDLKVETPDLRDTKTKVLDATNAAASQVDEAADYIETLIKQIKAVTDCEVLKLIVKEHLKSVTDEISKAVKLQTDINQKYLPLTKPPTTPWGVIKWVKNLILGTILPQLKAFIALAKEIIRLIKLMQDLVDAIENAAERLEECAKEIQDMAIQEVTAAVAKEIGEGLQNVLGDTMKEINKIQGTIGDIVDIANTKIDLSSPKAFINSVDGAVEGIENIANKYIESPAPEPPVETVVAGDKEFKIQGGTIISVTTVVPPA